MIPSFVYSAQIVLDKEEESTSLWSLSKGVPETDAFLVIFISFLSVLIT